MSEAQADLDAIEAVIGGEGGPAKLPDITAHPAVVAAQGQLDRVGELQRATAAEIAALEKELGVKPGASGRGQLAALAADGAVEKFAKLDAIRAHAGRLAEAAKVAGEDYQSARQKARRELTPAAHAVEFRPAARASALALLALIGAKWQERLASDRLQAAGFPPANGTFTSDLLDFWNNGVVLGLVRDGWLTKDEVRAAAPHMNGL